MSKNFHRLIHHAFLGEEFSFLSYPNYSISVEAWGGKGRPGASDSAAGSVVAGLCVVTSSCPLHLLRGHVVC